MNPHLETELLDFAMTGFQIQMILQGRESSSVSTQHVSTRTHSLPSIGEKIEIDKGIYRVERIYHRFQEDEKRTVSFLTPTLICLFESELSDTPEIQIPRRGDA